MIRNNSLKVVLFNLIVGLMVLFKNGNCEDVDSITQFGITWKFQNKVPSGRFVNGDYYIVGPAKVVSISPQPINNRNGSILNPVPALEKSGFDVRLDSRSFYDSTIRVKLPCTLKPGDALVSSISVDKVGIIERVMYPGKATYSPVSSICVLACLDKPVSANTFRPSYCDRSQKLYYADSIRWKMLPKLSAPRNVAVPSLKEWEDRFVHVWYDNCFFGFDAPVSYMPDYGKEVARSDGMVSLLLMLNYADAEKRKLLVGYLQYGIDLWGTIRAGHPGWYAHGGHGNGRKWPIVFAGMMLGDQEMASPTRTNPKVKFSEDMQTLYDNCWTGAKVVYGGHYGPSGFAGQAGWGKYEHLLPKDWPRNPNYKDYGGLIGEDYRRASTSVGWIGIALAAQLMHAEQNWNHPAFFDYAQRWMTENDSQAVITIMQQTGVDFSGKWERQGHTWDPFVDSMWRMYWKKIIK